MIDLHIQDLLKQHDVVHRLNVDRVKSTVSVKPSCRACGGTSVRLGVAQRMVPLASPFFSSARGHDPHPEPLRSPSTLSLRQLTRAPPIYVSERDKNVGG